MLKNKVSAYETLVSGYEDALTLIEMGDEEEDLSILPDAQQEVEKVRKSWRSSAWLPCSQESMTLITRF